MSANRRQRIYAAHPMTCYFTGHEHACLEAIADAFPEAEVFNPAGRYRTNAAWLRAWPRILSTLSAIVVFGDEDGVVGVGCLKEIADAIRLGLPVAMLDDDYRLRDLVGITFLSADIRSARRAGHLMASTPIAQMPRAGRASMIATLSSDTRTMRAKRSTM